MATVVAMPRHRRALGELSSTRSNKLAMTKHLQIIAAQDKATSTSYEIPSCKFNFSSTVKRSFDTFDDEDQENVDPELLLGSGKKAKGSDGEAVKPRHAAHFTLTTIKKPLLTESTKVARATLGVKPRPEQSSAKVDVAKDSNKVKFSGIAARSRQAGKRVVRVGQCVSNGHVPSSAPFSLMGNNGHVPLPRVGKKTRKAWDFVIREDTPEEELTNLMEHSTHTLDISDDENRGKFRDDRDKENIPPPGCPASAVRPVGRRDMMTEDVRTPLGKLNAADYYAPGCDASSVINAPQEELPASEPLNVEFGSIDGQLHGDVKAKANNIKAESIDKVEESNAGAADVAACDKSTTA
ncbi:MAG: hypothetical protein LQ338_002800 [Usnochroma carphineum]|nr:MAG: hypothetical protein LQ338_002800 [Usnochroma carphineum]